MSSAVLLRKELLGLLQDKILPELKRQSAPRIALAHLPLQVPPDIDVREIEHPLLEEDEALKQYPEARRWNDVQLHAVHVPVLFCVVEGEVDLRMGITTSMLQSLAPRERRKYAKGGYVFSLPSLSFLLMPSNVPQDTSVYAPWFRTEKHRGISRILSVRVLPVGALCHCSILDGEVYTVGYSLLIEDAQLAPVLGILLDELSASSVDDDIVQAQLLTLMLRLQRGMSHRVPQMTDGLHQRFPDDEPLPSQALPAADPLVEAVHKYIQLHLHKPLVVAEIARHVRVSPTHLNRVLRRQTGMSTMNYVMHQRIEIARLLLTTSEQPVQEIARIAGFPNAAHFSRAFARQTGLSPLKYRRRYAHPKDAHPQMYQQGKSVVG